MILKNQIDVKIPENPENPENREKLLHVVNP